MARAAVASPVYVGRVLSQLAGPQPQCLVYCAGVRNYIVVVWEEASLAVCLDMNLPCYNSAPMLPGSIDSSKEALFMSPDYLKIM